jgi:hypothetical protein
MSAKLNPKNGFIFRIVHKNNIPWILDNGLHCRNSSLLDPNYLNIGNIDLIDKRSTRHVPIEPYGTLSDYIPFYFTPYTPMLMNIKTGYNGVTKRPHSDIIILVSSIHKVREIGVPILFTDRHGYLSTANFYSDPTHLDKIDWDILQRRDFRRDNDDLGKVERYQAEALVFKSMTVDALIGILCYDKPSAALANEALSIRGINLQAVVRPGWYV